MAHECEKLATCGFFRKYAEVKDLACRGFINQYCKGDKMDQCKRKEYSRKHGEAPSDDMMPKGQNIRLYQHYLYPRTVGIAVPVGPAFSISPECEWLEFIRSDSGG